MNSTFEQDKRLFRRQIRELPLVSHQSLNQKAAGRGKNGDFRVPERNVLNVYEHRNAEGRHLQTGMATFGTSSQHPVIP